jgi:hypothetical protein
MTNSPGWAVELVGEKFDLDDLRNDLAPPFDPWMEDYATDVGSTALLRSSSWTALNKAAEVYRDAGRMIDRINGALLLIHPDARPVKLGQPIRFGEDGKRQHILFAETGHFRLTGGRIRGTVNRGSAAPAPPEQPKLQKWLKEAELDDTRAELLIQLNRADNWFDLFKSAELVRRLAGGQSKLFLVLGSDKKEWERIWQTANCYRHAPDPKKYPLPPVPAELEGAREFLLKVISRIL